MAEPRRSDLPPQPAAPLRPVQGRRPAPGAPDVRSEDMPSADPFLAGSSPLPTAVDPAVADDQRVVRLENQARQGKPIGRMRWVLGIGIALVAVAFLVTWFASV